MPQHETFGRSLRRFREAAGYTQAALAERCGLDPQTIYRYETDAMEPTVSVLERIEKVLGIEMLAMPFPQFDKETARIFDRIEQKHGFTRMTLHRSRLGDYSIMLLMDRDDGMGVNGSGFGATTNEALQRALLSAENNIKAGYVFQRAEPVKGRSVVAKSTRRKSTGRRK